MCKRMIPFAHAKSIYEIPVDFYKSHHVKYLFLDLDNTLDSYKVYEPSDRAIRLISELKSGGITPIILSNNHAKRVKRYADILGIAFYHHVFKPFSFKIKKIMKELGIAPEEAMMIGDQMITDVNAGNGAKIKVILTDKIVKEDQFTTHFNRFFERPFRNHYMKYKVKDWREAYGQD